jgi:hypothetical protein
MKKSEAKELAIKIVQHARDNNIPMNKRKTPKK